MAQVDLGSHGRHTANCLTEIDVACEQFAHAKVAYFDGAVVVDEDVGGGEIAVHNGRRVVVQVDHAVGDAVGDVVAAERRGIEVVRLVANELFQATAADILGDQSFLAFGRL